MRAKNSGFTLIEVLVIAPIIILFIGAFIALIVNLTGESLQLQAQNSAAYNTQDALDSMEASALQATSFLATTGTVQSPQGKDNATAAFVNDDGTGFHNLIMNSVATTKGPYDPNRSIIYTGAGSCDSTNPVYKYMTVYFVNTTENALYKRTILPQVPACASPWQRGSCKESLVAANASVCKANDEKILTNVSGMTIQYYADASSDTPLDASQAGSATSIEITLTTSKQVASNPVTYNASARISTHNAQVSESTQTPPALPSINANNNPNSGNQDTPYASVFSWTAVGSATGYVLKYRTDSGSWTTVNLGNGTTSYTVNAASRKRVVDIELTVQSQAGDYLYGTASSTIPRWQDCGDQNGWTRFSSTYAPASYTRTSAGVIGLRGLVKGGTIGGGATSAACTLPVGFRPAQNLIFQVAGYQGGTSGAARIDVYTDGTVRVQSGDATWVSLSGITFLAKGAPTSVAWTSGAWSAGWSNHTTGCTAADGTGWGCLKYAKDTLGRVFVEGLGKPGTQTAGTVVSSSFSASGIAPSHNMHITSNASSASAINITPTGTIQIRGVPASTTYQSLSFTYYPATFTSWATLPLISSSWVEYGPSTYSPAQCYKGADDLVMVRGLIKGTSSSTAATITTTATCGGVSADGQLIMPAWTAGSANTLARVDVLANGSLTFTAPYGNTTTTANSLDNVRFIAD